MTKFVLVLALCMICAADEISEKARDYLIEAANKFSINLFQDYWSSKNDSNLIISALGIWLSLTMAAFGAGGNTYAEMKRSLFLPNDEEFTFKGFKLLQKELREINDFDLRIHKKLYVAMGSSIKLKFKNITETIFNCAISPFDSSLPTKAALGINKWFENASNKAFKEIINQNDISSNLRMILLNVVYFRGEFEYEFYTDDTKLKLFNRFLYNDSLVIKNFVPTMTTELTFNAGYLSDLKSRFVQFPYKNEDAQMTIILPDENTYIESVVKNLTFLNVSLLEKIGSPTDVKVSLPRFRIVNDIDLNENIKRLGMNDMFNPKANFTNISNEPLWLSKIKQKAFIGVTEKDNEAGALTPMGIQFVEEDYSDSEVFDVDRPSLFLVTVKNLIVSMGVIMDPKY